MSNETAVAEGGFDAPRLRERHVRRVVDAALPPHNVSSAATTTLLGAASRRGPTGRV